MLVCGGHSDGILFGAIIMIVYKTTTCPRCKQLTAYLDSIGHPHQEASLEDAGAITDMRLAGFFGVEAPIIQDAYGYHGPEEFFNGGNLDIKRLERLL